MQSSNNYIKDFEGWSQEKQQINTHVGPYPQVGRMYFVAPLTTKDKNTPFYYSLQSVDFGVDSEGNKIISRVLLGQCKIIDNKRLFRKTKQISYSELEHIKKLLYELYLKPYKE